jgi:hypothetical protein
MTPVRFAELFAARCDMNDPKYELSIRWGAFTLRVVGRGPILAWLAAVASIIGIKLLI